MLEYRTLINSTVWTLSNATFQICDLINKGYEDVSLAQGQSRVRGFRLRSTASDREAIFLHVSPPMKHSLGICFPNGQF